MAKAQINLDAVGGGMVLNPQIVWSPSGSSGVAYTDCTNIPVTQGKTYCFSYFRSKTPTDDASVTGGDIISSFSATGTYANYITRGTIFKATANTVSFSWSSEYQIGAPMLVQLD